MRLLIFFFMPILILSCDNDNDGTINPLIETGLIGEWEINGRGTNNVLSLEVFCCETLTFLDDNNLRDLIGSYTFNQQGVVTNGIFTVNAEENTIEYFTENNNMNSVAYSVNNNTLEVWYLEGTNRNWTTYNKQ
ncbi:hypothetical protein BWZ20_01250 [Winogradskyella sp. J14-2]|uniref:hypothetical protein n=1 Tax=Winogradskyella sp. J14-2 TaxID=1936080 RepID=UPI000972B031|nr:hypothetical protein [Winogradskyella sp. J14-2]APY07007.1 hypothetical protein BWZ20_01250 [Winogradskyella sp. J14-2]